ncbi:restriction endonuclease subunit S [Halopseudomonas pelagia]|uniref:restriction endonuclease subunit S n=1 Tax=Halopseudomonas pelagia TaxID=553151 RepID=UPI0003A8382E|nr:restriction endonuclease subunit S [Halopseudomonas pelagia]
MSSVIFMERLLDGVEVEWKLLGSVFDIFAGGDVPKESFSEVETDRFKVPILSNGIGNKALYGWTEKPKIQNPSLTISARGTIGWTNFVVKPFFPIVRLLALTPKAGLNLKYGYYFMKTIENGYKVPPAGIPQLTKPMLKDVRIPIPCPENPNKSLEIQAEIVRILDVFSAYTAELTAELTARKKQYHYYRDKLLSFEEGKVEWKTLGDVTKKWYSGGTPTAGNPEYYDGGEIPWLRTQEVKFADIETTDVKITQSALKNSSAKWIPKNCVIVAISGATAGRSAINKIPLTTNQHCGCLEIDSTKALYRYVFHWVSYNYENIKALGQGARGDLNSSIIKGFKFPVPYADDPKRSLEEQARIVAILDKFDALTHSISEGLPREIALRQQQYEYYRDRLLSFPKPDDEAAA